MPIETLDDIITEIADLAGIYGAHGEGEECPPCRACFESQLKSRILEAVAVEQKLAQPELRGWQKKLGRADVCACHGMTNCQLAEP